MFTFATTRDLKLVYFDGCSADKAEGVDDTQDILIWGKLGNSAGRGPGQGEHVRLVDACEWAKEFDVDGFIRMEMDLYVTSLIHSGLTQINDFPARSCTVTSDGDLSWFLL